MPSEASLANLKAPWQKGQSANERGRTRGYARILHASRKASPEAIEKAIECMRDETAPWNNRLKAVEIILDRAWGAPDQSLKLDAGESVNSITLNIVSVGETTETITITAHDAPSSPQTHVIGRNEGEADEAIVTATIEGEAGDE
jgi:hypothetical protein